MYSRNPQWYTAFRSASKGKELLKRSDPNRVTHLNPNPDAFERFFVATYDLYKTAV